MLQDFGILISEGRGKIGNVVASRNPHGAYFREWVIPANPDTVAQQTARTRLQMVNSHWIGLNDDQRKAWFIMAPNYRRQNGMGDTYTPSGYHLHNRINMNLITFGFSFLDVPLMPIKVFSKPIQTLTYPDPTRGLRIRFATFGGSPANVGIFATAPQSAGVNFVKSEFRLLYTTPSVDGNQYFPNRPYVAKFGIPPTGSKVFFHLRWLMPSTGQTVTGNKASIIIP